MTTTTDLAAGPPAGALALRAEQIDWTPAQRAALAQMGIDEAPPGEQQMFLHVCQRSGLDPFARQIYMIARTERRRGEPDRVKWTIQTGIDGFRVRAEDHPQYAGTLDPEWCGDDGVWRTEWTERRPPTMARVKVLRHDRDHPISLPIMFREFAATFADGNLQGNWRTRPCHMIQKCAEVASLRKAFPKVFAGIYIPEEMEATDAHADRRPDPPHRGGAPVTADELTGRRTGPPAGPVDGVVDAELVDGELVEEPPASAADADPGRAPGGAAATREQIRALNALFVEAEVARPSERARLAALLIEEPLSGPLTVDQAARVIERLRDLRGHAQGLSGAAAERLNTDDLNREAAEQAAAEQADRDATHLGDAGSSTDTTADDDATTDAADEAGTGE